jgi:hypothetical protein
MTVIQNITMHKILRIITISQSTIKVVNVLRLAVAHMRIMPPLIIQLYYLDNKTNCKS